MADRTKERRRIGGPRSARVLAGAIAVAATAVVSGSVQPTAAATAVRSFNTWTLYAENAQQRICFLASTPSSTQPDGVKRDTAVLYVSAWPREGVRSEISVKLGFPPRKGSEPVISVTGPGNAQPTSFRMFVKDDRAFVADATQELKLLEAMKKGSRLIVQATSERGLSVTDTYALTGTSAGVQALAAGCP